MDEVIDLRKWIFFFNLDVHSSFRTPIKPLHFAHNLFFCVRPLFCQSPFWFLFSFLLYFFVRSFSVSLPSPFPYLSISLLYLSYSISIYLSMYIFFHLPILINLLSLSLIPYGNLLNSPLLCKFFFDPSPPDAGLIKQ